MGFTYNRLGSMDEMNRIALKRIAGGSFGAVALCCVVLVVLASCGAPTPFLVNGPGQAGNDPPTLTILSPDQNITVSQGSSFLIEWTDSDPDDNARISFDLVSTANNTVLNLVRGLEENDLTGPDSFAVSTDLIPTGSYNLRGTIEDGTNNAVEVFAQVGGATASTRVLLRVVGQGEGQQTVPPRVTLVEPTFNQSVSQDDVLVVTLQPTDGVPNMNTPYDPDSNITIYVVLDTDTISSNDDPANPDPGDIVVLRQQTITAESFEPITFNIAIDIAQVPPLPAGDPYFIRVTALDGTNTPVHSYAVGTINVTTLASGLVDLFQVGRTVSGATFYGFNAAANTGSKIRGISDFDTDGVDDFVMVARYGNPRNFGQVGEAYLLYGRDRERFGGSISVNTIGSSLSGVIFEGTPVRDSVIPADDPRTDGIVDVNFVSDLTGDGRPELLFGMPHVHGAYDGMDFDPGDDGPETDETIVFACYPDFLPNNASTLGLDQQWYAGGMALIVDSDNRDSDPFITPIVQRLESTSIAMELVGTEGADNRAVILDDSGENTEGNILTRAQTEDEGNRIAGARILAGHYDFWDAFGLFQPPRNGLWGQTFSPLGDQNNDGVPELMISAPRNELYLEELDTEYPFGSTHEVSTIFRGSIAVLPGLNYGTFARENDDPEDGNSQVPWVFQNMGSCAEANPVARSQIFPADTFDINAEDPTDFLGGAVSAGDFNQDGLDDILCGAPLNDRSTLLDTGAAYVLYSRAVPGTINLADADNPTRRSPMLRIRGVRTGDQIGTIQDRALDFNGDRIDDVVIASPRADFGGVERTSCFGDFDGDGDITANDFVEAEFEECRENFGAQVFSSDQCKVYDFDNDEDIDDDDKCVFCCEAECSELPDACVFGQTPGNCCANLVDNGFVGVVFGGVFTDGDRTINQLATSDLPGVVFYGAGALHRAGTHISSAGDFNQDGFGDLLITVPGEARCDVDVPADLTCSDVGSERLGVVYLIFGGTGLTNRMFELSDVGTEDLPGIVFVSPFVRGRPNEAAPLTAASIGDINNDGFDDIAIGNEKADFIDQSFPQGPDAPGGDASVGRRRDAGNVYVVYGNNFGSNRGQ